MGFNIRTYRLPPGTLVRAVHTIYRTVPIRTGAHGIVVCHESRGRLRIMWIPSDEFAGGEYTLKTDDLSISITGYTTSLDVISFPDGLAYEPW